MATCSPGRSPTSTRSTRSSSGGSCPPRPRSSRTALACAILGLVEPLLAVVLFAFLALGAIAIPLAARHRARRPSERLIRARAGLHAGFASDLAGLADLTAFGAEARLVEDLGARSRSMAREQRRLASVRGASGAAGSVLAGLAGLAVLALAIDPVRDGAIDGVFLASLPLVAFAAYEAVQPLGDAFREVELSRAAAVRTFEIADAPSPVVEPAVALLPPAHPSVELRHVGFRYDERSPLVLDDVTVSLRPGDRLGLTGPSGAGKTTIVGLLLRFFDPGSGSVLLDGADARSYRADDVRALMGVVPQHVFLFNGTLRDNLLLADGEADDARIADACDRAGLGDVPALLATGPRDDGRGRRPQAERWGTPAGGDRPCVPQGRADPDPGRGDGQPRRRHRGRGPGPRVRVRARPDRARDLASPRGAAGSPTA